MESRRNRRSNHGITLIALVISIIVMLILAGVSINAIVGDDGILSRTQYSTFLSEMTAVEEVVQMWKAGEAIGQMGEETKAIPANGLCKVSDLTKTERLAGEVGYYRIWSMTETAPITSVLSSADIFNTNFESELMYYPAGVQDLFYLNNEVLGIESDKTYVIDAATGMIYSMTGIRLKGVSCYSANMATAVMSGNLNSPVFAESEVSGTGNDDKLAGNTQDEYLEDGTKNPDYNPYGFKIIANPGSDNIFKLYNNGDLYGKGKKGIQLNTSVEEMEKIDEKIWQEFKFSSNIGTIKKTICGRSNDIYFIDQNDDLWVYGTNYNNKFGLTQEQQVEYTGREAVKVNLNGEKVSKIFPNSTSVFIVTKNGELLSAGKNVSGQLGIGRVGEPEKFTKVVGLSNVENIKNIGSLGNGPQDNGEGEATIIQYNTGEIYVSGYARYALDTYLSTKTLSFKQIWNGISNQISEIYAYGGLTVYALMNDGSLYVEKNSTTKPNVIEENMKDTLQKMNIQNVNKLYMLGDNIFIIECIESNNKVYYAFNSNSYNACHFGKDFGLSNSIKKLDSLNKINGIKEIIVSNSSFYFLTNDNKVYGCGRKAYLGISSDLDWSDTIIDCGLSGIETFCDEKTEISNVGVTSLLLLKKGDKYYSIGNSELIFGNNILQKSWNLVANNVKYFNGKDTAYIDRDGNLWIAGSDSRKLGLGSDSETVKEIPNYVMCNDANIKGKCKEVRMCGFCTYVLTMDGELYATGVYSENDKLQFAGWSDAVNKTTFTKILSNVAMFSTGTNDDYLTKIAFTKDGKAYYFGKNYTGLGSTATGSPIVPTEFTFPTILGNIDNINKWLQTGSFRSFAITKAGKLYMSGNWYHMFDGGNPSSIDFNEFTYGLDALGNDETIIDVVNCHVQGALMLTNKGRLFGYGSGKTLGIGKSSGDNVNNQYISSMSDVIQISSGNGFYIAVKSDGTVWGTGSNTYGILGRWIGIDRKQPNSRYKTAFEWVECPELEI